MVSAFATGLPRAASNRRMDSCSPISAACKYVEVCEQVRVPQHLLHMMDRPAGFEPATASLVSEVVEVQVNRGEPGA
jgi:hypothetical protein